MPGWQPLQARGKSLSQFSMVRTQTSESIRRWQLARVTKYDQLYGAYRWTGGDWAPKNKLKTEYTALN